MTMLFACCAGLLLASASVDSFFVAPGEKVAVSPKTDFAGKDYRGYSLFGYLKDLPWAVRETDPSKVHWNKREPLYSSFSFTGFLSGKTPPETFAFDTAGLPCGDYRINMQCMAMVNGKDTYKPYPFEFAIRDRTRQRAPAEPFTAEDGVLAVPYVTGFAGDPLGAIDVDIPWQTGFSAPKKSDPVEVQTKFRMFHDNDWIYLAVACNEPEAMDKVAALPKREHDSIMIVREECLEINFDPSGKGMSFYKIGLRPTGDVSDYFAEDDNTGTGSFAFDIRRESGVVVKTRMAQKGWVAELAIPFGYLCAGETAANGEWTFLLGRCRYPQKRGLASVWPAGADGFCSTKSFARMKFQNFVPTAHKWEFNLGKTVTAPKDGKLAFTASATVVNRSRDFRFATVRAILKDINGRVVARTESERVRASADRVTPVAVMIPDVPKGPAVLHLELLSAEGRLEAQIVQDVKVEYEPVRIVLTAPAYRDCVFESMKLKALEGLVILEEGVGRPLALTLTGAGTDEKVEFAAAEATNRFSFAFADKAKGDYVLKAGGAVKRVRNLPFKPGEVWIDGNGVMYREGEKFLPFGFFSDQYTEDYPGLTIAQMYTGGMKEPSELVRFCEKSGKFRRGFIVRPQQMMGTNGRKLFETKGEQGALTEDQKAELRLFAETAREQPWFMAYYLCDEPEGRDLNPEWFRCVREFLTEIDPYHPTMVLNYSIDGTIRYCEGGDITCPDAYLVYYTDGTARTPHRISYDKALAASTHARSSAWIAPQLFDWPTSETDKMACGPDFDQIREQAMLALIGDVRGFMWYTRYSYGGAFTEHMRLGPKYLLKELLESRDVFLSPTVKDAVKAKSNGPDKTFIAGLKSFGGEKLVIAANTSDKAVTAELSGAALPSRLYANGEGAAIAVKGGRLTDAFAPYEVKVYYDREKSFGHAANRTLVYDAEKNRRRPGNLAAAKRILTYKEALAMFKKVPDDWYPRIVASSSEKMSYDLPFAYFLQDGLRDELPIVPYLTWNPERSDKSPWVRVEFGARRRFSKIVLYRCRDAEGRLALLSGSVEANGTELAKFDDRENARIEITVPETEAESVTVKIGARDAAAKCRLLSEFEVY